MHHESGFRTPARRIVIVVVTVIFIAGVSGGRLRRGGRGEAGWHGRGWQPSCCLLLMLQKSGQQQQQEVVALVLPTVSIHGRAGLPPEATAQSSLVVALSLLLFITSALWALGDSGMEEFEEGALPPLAGAVEDGGGGGGAARGSSALGLARPGGPKSHRASNWPLQVRQGGASPAPGAPPSHPQVSHPPWLLPPWPWPRGLGAPSPRPWDQAMAPKKGRPAPNAPTPGPSRGRLTPTGRLAMPGPCPGTPPPPGRGWGGSEAAVPRPCLGSIGLRPRTPPRARSGWPERGGGRCRCWWRRRREREGGGTARHRLSLSLSPPSATTTPPRAEERPGVAG